MKETKQGSKKVNEAKHKRKQIDIFFPKDTDERTEAQGGAGEGGD